jgi:protein gp37
MADSSTIEWTEATWNPVTGCTKVSAGCKNCYAERMARRLKAMGTPQYANGFQLTEQPAALNLPRRWKRGRTVFVNSMSDLFHPAVRLPYIQQVFQVMNECPQHSFQVLTKRPEIAAAHKDQVKWSPNIWMGTSVENALVIDRIHSLRKIPATVRFLSLEPLLGRLRKLPLDGIDWVIVGGESGPGARPMNGDWVREIREQCIAAGAAFFFKQWGGVQKGKAGRELDGRTWDEMPEKEAEKPDERVRIAAACG